jgi:hypothetical protein
MYMLEGVDIDWIHTDAFARIANYTDIKPVNIPFM